MFKRAVIAVTPTARKKVILKQTAFVCKNAPHKANGWLSSKMTRVNLQCVFQPRHDLPGWFSLIEPIQLRRLYEPLRVEAGTSTPRQVLLKLVEGAARWN